MGLCVNLVNCYVLIWLGVNLVVVILIGRCLNWSKNTISTQGRRVLNISYETFNIAPVQGLGKQDDFGALGTDGVATR